MSNLLYYYCGGKTNRVRELGVSLFSLLNTNQSRSFRIGIALDQEAAEVFDWRTAESKYDIDVQILDHCTDFDTCTPASRHYINRSRGLERFTYKRALMLDIDTIVNRSLDSLFDDIHPDVEYFTTFVHFVEPSYFPAKHQFFYNAITTDYDQRPLYCALGLHAVSSGWPYFQQMISYCKAIDELKQKARLRRVFTEEYAINLLLLKNGRKVHFPRVAINKAPWMPIIPLPESAYVWHYMLGRSFNNPVWLEMLRMAEEENFLGITQLRHPST